MNVPSWSSLRRALFIEFIALLGVVLTVAQRAFALVAFDGAQPRDLSLGEREAAREIFGAIAVVPPLARAVIAMIAGAQSGKTYLGALRLLHLAITCDLSRLAPGERAFAIIVAPDLRLARQALRYAYGAAHGSFLRSWLRSESADGFVIERPDGHRVAFEVLPATRGGSALRGRRLVGVLLDEGCFLLGEDHVVNDVELFSAIAPRVLPDGQILFFSTPWARLGLLFELFSKNHGAPKTALAAHAPTRLMRGDDPHIVGIIARERERDPENAAREYDAQFVDASSALLRGEDVDAAVDRGVLRRPYRSGVMYRIAIDIGLRRDRTAICAFHLEMREGNGGPPVRMLVIDAMVILKPGLLHRVSIDDVDREVAALCSAFHVHQVHGDIAYADAIGPMLRQRGIRFIEEGMHPAAQRKRAAALGARFASRAIKIVDEPILIAELKDVRIQRSSGGAESIGAVGSKHDDTVDVTLLAEGASSDMHAATSEDGIEVTTRVINRGLSFGGIEFRQEFFQRMPDGTKRRVGPPRWHPQHVRDLAAAYYAGGSNDEIDAWARSQGLPVVGDTLPGQPINRKVQ